MATFQQIIDNAQVFLNDTAGTRYTDSQLLGYANEALKEIRRVRPDLFFGSYTTTLSTYGLSDTVPIGDEYLPYMTDYMIFRSEVRDDEYALDGRAAALFSRFRNGLIGL